MDDKKRETNIAVYTIDAKTNEKYYIVKLGNIELFKVSKTNTIDRVINMIGKENINEVIN